MVYQFKSGSWIRGVNPQIAGEMCERLEGQGKLTAKALVDANREESAPLHGYFIWDNSVAGELYREQQGRHIINCLCKVESQQSEPVRAFFTLIKTEPTYRHINHIMSVRSEREILLENAINELKAFQRKYRQLQELAKVFEEIRLLTEGDRNETENS